MSETHLSRETWIAACKFHDADEAEVLREVARRVEAAMKAKGPQPVVLFDLDSTLYDTGPRHRHIIREWLADAGERLPEPVRTALGKVEELARTYSMRDLFHRVGLNLAHEEIENAWTELRAFWQPRFFSNAYLPHDLPYEGAADYVRELYALGADIIYLTGRDSPGMLLGTTANLERDGFPIGGARTLLVMKPQREGDDLQHKVGVATVVNARGVLVASFENEPRNLVGLQKAFPDALHVFVETVCSDAPAEAAQNLYRIRTYPKR